MPVRGTGRGISFEESRVPLALSALAQGRQALAASEHAAALSWLERAHRLVPADPNAALALASACLADDPRRAQALFAAIAGHHDVAQAWLGLVAAGLRCGDPTAAMRALSHALSHHALTPEVAAFATRMAPPAGWCALTSDGRLEIHGPAPHHVTLDGRALRGVRLPSAWAAGRRIAVTCNGVPALGSPIHLDLVRRLAGCVEPGDGGIAGWAWHPHDPATHPRLTLTDAAGIPIRTWQADDETITVPDTGALARPRAVRVPAAWLHGHAGPFHLLGANGRALLGSPLDPRTDQAAHQAAAQAVAAAYPAASRSVAATRIPPPSLRIDAPPPSRPIGAGRSRRDQTIIIPVHDGGRIVQDCLDAVLDTLPATARLLVVDDGSTDPSLVALLDDLARRGGLILLRNKAARGFPAAANAGLRAARGRDVILLNSDALPPPRWIERLAEAAYSAPDIGTVTPLSNEASILSYPGAAGTNPRPDRASVLALDRLAVAANPATLIDIPVGVGFCMYVRRDCLNATGLLRADLFAQGYGEETDFCLRSRHLGWRHVALPGLFVGHLSGRSFGTGAVHLRARNARIIEQLHPGYHAVIDWVLARDPLAGARRRIDAMIWRRRARAWKAAAILITHKDGGGVEQRVLASAGSHARAGRRPIILRPARLAEDVPAISVHDGVEDDLPNLVFRLPEELPTLRRLLRAANPRVQEVHHLLGFHAAIHDLIRSLGVPWIVHVHDYAWFCPRVVLLTGHGHYCGEPDLAGCEDCIADHGHHLEEDISVAALRERSAPILLGANLVVTPSDDTGSRIRRHFPGLVTETVPHSDDAAIPAPRMPSGQARARPLVCVVGAIGVHKGYDILLACARDAQRRNLDLDYVIVGHTEDDARIMATGRVFVTGIYKPHEAVGLIAEQGAHLGFVASVCPETWCLSLDDIWRAGLSAAAFDIGAPAERIRRSGRGFLLPLGLSISAINNALVAAIRSGIY